MIDVHSSINDRDDDIRLARGNVPCVFHLNVGADDRAVLPDIPEVLLLVEERIVRDGTQFQFTKEIRRRPLDTLPLCELFSAGE